MPEDRGLQVLWEKYGQLAGLDWLIPVCYSWFIEKWLGLLKTINLTHSLLLTLIDRLPTGQEQQPQHYTSTDHPISHNDYYSIWVFSMLTGLLGLNMISDWNTFLVWFISKSVIFKAVVSFFYPTYHVLVVWQLPYRWVHSRGKTLCMVQMYQRIG